MERGLGRKFRTKCILSPQAMIWFWNVGTNYISVKFITFLKLGIVQPKLNNKFPSYLTQAALENVTILIYFASFLHKTYGNNGHPSSLKQLKLGPILVHFKFDVVCVHVRERERSKNNSGQELLFTSFFQYSTWISKVLSTVI